MSSNNSEKLKELTQMIKKKKEALKVNSQNSVSNQAEPVPVPIVVQPVPQPPEIPKAVTWKESSEKQSINQTKKMSEERSQSPEKQIPMFVPIKIPEQLKQIENEKHHSQSHLQVEKPNTKFFSENQSIAISKPSVDEGNQIQKQKLVKFTRFLLKDIDKIKQTIANVEGCLKGIQYIQKRILTDKQFHKKIKNKLNLLRDITQQ